MGSGPKGGASMAEGRERDAIPREWLEEFEAAARRSLETRMRYAFIQTYKPVLDDAKFRAFDTMEQYRRWCEQALPDWLGVMGAFDYRQAQEVKDAFARRGVRYLFI